LKKKYTYYNSLLPIVVPKLVVNPQS